MADNFDPGKPNGGQNDGDAEILALFRQWIGECRIADGAEGGTPAWLEAMGRRDEIERRIASGCGGPVGLAVKTFIMLRSECSDWAPSLAQFRCEDLFGGGDPDWNVSLLASILRDAAVLVPEIAECAAAVVHEDATLIDAEIGIRWCHVLLATGARGPRLLKQGELEALKIRAKLAALLDRIERTEAKTPRGEVIKARHARRGSVIGATRD
jgi:hypothetical protein